MNFKNSEFTLDELKILAENGQKDLQYAVGYYYENGINTEVDFKQAAEWYEKAASKNHVEALMHLGIFYAQGKGVEKNGKKALEYIQKAAKTGDKNAQYNLARCYEEGIGTVVDYSRAFDWYKKAAEQNDYRAMCCMGSYFLMGQAVPCMPERAFQLFEKAANANIPAAQYNLYILDRYGEGVEKDIDLADTWRMKAAQNGFKLAIEEIHKEVGIE